MLIKNALAGHDYLHMASDSRAPSPIQKLNHDILWTLFSVIAEDDAHVMKDQPNPMFDGPPPLETIISMSRVCQAWRDVLLPSANIWGKVLQVDCLAPMGWKWRAEIMRRTGTASLHIKGCIAQAARDFESDSEAPGFGTEAFTIGLLRSTWSRVRRIELFLVSMACPLQWKEILALPAPRLESFKVNGIAHRAGPENLFNGVAPFLRVMHTDYVGHNLNAPWAHQLHSLELWGTNQSTADDILKALPSMPLLRHLALTCLFRGLPGPVPVQAPLPAGQSIHLPKLKSLHLAGGFSCIYLAVAHALKPSEECELVWREIVGPLSTEESATLSDVLARYLKMSLDKGHGADRRAPSSGFFVTFRPRLLPKIVSLLLQLLLEANLSSLKRLDLFPEVSAILDQGDNTATFFKSLLSVTAINMSDSGYTMLYLATLPGIISFPELQEMTIHYNYIPDLHHVAELHDYFLSREKASVAVPVLHLTGNFWQQDWSILEDIKGLQVFWVEPKPDPIAGKPIKCSYICDGSKPGMLSFVHIRNRTLFDLRPPKFRINRQQ
ncbi:hypothetical protein CVT26_016017 [Gymnopilus dilepis]|uniref:F-box domain-containing protein n=1 Tax=Gymnopilus dilepis TaxID=231916 RepID=A0A409YDI2_9AGAR|nr:hypothetical protein CVT26_016017 [Gymnopilus dilepis]